MKRSIMNFIPLAMAALLFVGCTSPQMKSEGEAAPVVESGAAGQEGAGAEGEGASTAGMQEGAGWSGSPLEDPQSTLYTKVIYFDFDRSEIRSEYRDVVIAHGQYLAANATAMVTVEGHCDERGSREYNIGLGERRANAVKQLLIAQGASVNQITVVSYGEERPAAMGSDENAWAQNRRAVLAY
jgi:peptidoglycan-associated lipoprotein